MATTLLLATSNAIEALCKIVYPTCVTWNTTTKQWKYSLKPTKQFLLHIVTTSILALHLLIMVMLTVYCTLYKSDWFPVSNLLLVTILLACILSWTYLDGFLIVYGKEMVSVVNWAIFCIKQLRIFPCAERQSNVFIELVLQIQKGIKSSPNVDIFGIIAGYVLISTVPVLFVVSFAIAISDMDLIYISIFLCSKYFGFSIYWLSSWYVKIIRYVGVLYIVQFVVIVVPTFTILLSSIFQVLICTLTYLKLMDLTYPNTKLFKTIIVAKSLVVCMLKWFNGIFLSGAFFLLLVATNLSFYGKKLLPGEFYIFVLFIAFTVWWSTVILLHYENFTYKSSCKIIEKWKSTLAVGGLAKPKYIKLIVYSLRLIALPVGDIGIVDRDIQINYFSAVLTYLVNTSIIFKDML